MNLNAFLLASDQSGPNRIFRRRLHSALDPMSHLIRQSDPFGKSVKIQKSPNFFVIAPVCIESLKQFFFQRLYYQELTDAKTVLSNAKNLIKGTV